MIARDAHAVRRREQRIVIRTGVGKEDPIRTWQRAPLSPGQLAGDKEARVRDTVDHSVT